MRWLVLILLLLYAPPIDAEIERPIWDLGEGTSRFEIQALNYPWEFYWQQLLGPEDPVPNPTAIARPPLLRWKDIRSEAGTKFLPGIGYGTYRLRFKGLAPRAEGYELKIHHEVSAYLALLYREDEPQQVYRVSNGVVGPHAAASAAQELPTTLRFSSPAKDTVWIGGWQGFRKLPPFALESPDAQCFQNKNLIYQGRQGSFR